MMRLRFQIRDLFWGVAIIAILLCWGRTEVKHKQLKQRYSRVQLVHKSQMDKKSDLLMRVCVWQQKTADIPLGTKRSDVESWLNITTGIAHDMNVYYRFDEDIRATATYDAEGNLHAPITMTWSPPAR